MSDTITSEELRRVVHYDPMTGEFGYLTRKGRVGTQHQGYIRIKIRGNKYLAHRLAWLYSFDEWPSLQLDHVNGDKADNRIANLREANHSINGQNQHTPHRHGVTGYLGVCFSKSEQRFRAQIKVEGRIKILGRFRSAEEAYEVYLKAKRLMHAGCTI